MDKLIVIGNLTADPESRIVDTANGQQKVCNFTVAVNRYAHGNKTTKYYRVACWNKQAENAEKYLAKGSKVCVSGAVSARAYQANDGTLRATLEIAAEEIEYLSARSSAGESGQTLPSPAPETDEDGFMDIPEGSDEEMPFI